ncbi:hypothetical protein B4589_001540 [Halolamina sp. CBA1230]|uniref:DUF5789 family protein n=1 Tax=Halolamina sp. CBA1230 TaxID=1853690 RepID=UPI0009A1EFF6|nr:hypothetical protein [Halolamina sp. CBA1230]QKY19122.1 hypothetical protein B4589_001540 [Halolamina sp. CBA1230]
MALKPAETRELFDRECSFPINRDAVLERVGNLAIESPNGEDSELEVVLSRSSDTTYTSAEELHNTLMGNLGDDHVGRKYYDDRSNTNTHDTELSF